MADDRLIRASDQDREKTAELLSEAYALGRLSRREQQTIDLALDGRPVPVLIESGFDELRAGDLDGAPMDTYMSWKYQHTSNDRFPHGESVRDALRRYACALRRLLARDETVTLVIVHELALRYITAAATSGAPPVPGTAFPNAVPYLLDQRAAQRAAASLDALALAEQPQAGR